MGITSNSWIPKYEEKGFLEFLKKPSTGFFEVFRGFSVFWGSGVFYKIFSSVAYGHSAYFYLKVFAKGFPKTPHQKKTKKPLGFFISRPKFLRGAQSSIEPSKTLENPGQPWTTFLENLRKPPKTSRYPGKPGLGKPRKTSQHPEKPRETPYNLRFHCRENAWKPGNPFGNLPRKPRNHSKNLKTLR